MVEFSADEAVEQRWAQGDIPCTVVVLTRNNAGLLPRCIASLDRFQEVVVCDGDSVDATVEIALAAGCRVIRQPDSARNADGALVDYAEARNAAGRTARSPWILTLDSDERLGEELAEELAGRLATVDADVDAFEARFRYVVDDVQIDAASTYPGFQIRVYRRHLEYGGAIHERVGVDPERVARLEYWYYRFPPPALTLLRRWIRYGTVEASNHHHPVEWWRSLGKVRINRARWVIRGYRNRGAGPSDRAMPLRYELLRPAVELGLLTLDIPIVLWNWVKSSVTRFAPPMIRRRMPGSS